jgi:hypothetical protein
MKKLGASVEFPSELDVVKANRNVDNIRRPLPYNLKGDAQIPALRVARRRKVHPGSLSASRA